MKTRQILKEIPFIGDFLKSIYKNHSRKLPSFWINRYIKNTDLNIVQIGSNDGNTGDPIFALVKKKKRWKALFVEPVPYLFQRLKTNYSQEARFTFENVAINDGTKQIFYSVSEDANKQIKNLPPWHDQLGSFNRENISKHLNGIIEPFIVETEIQGMRLIDLFERNKIDKLDLLHIDTEGYDFKILSQLDLDKYYPAIILFEHKHLTLIEKKHAIRFVEDKYFLFEFGGDCLCIAKHKLKKSDLTTLTKRLIPIELGTVT